jgi:aspartyl protease family protein
MGDNAPYIVFYVVAAVFVASSLFGRGLKLGKAAKMALAWLAIFAVVFAIFAFRGELAGAGKRLGSELTGAPIVEGGLVRVPMSDDGHFWVQASLNGHEVRFMVDSGASMTTVSSETARDSRIPATGDRTEVLTANGPAWVTLSSADLLEVGSIQRKDFPVQVSDQKDMELLGMNFLSSLGGWRVEGKTLVLQP